ncbi:hypothetical protein MKW94_025709 [Papaver nudicaule]|uniref:Uncharacterized protein n=1 Tax=Papaver nudicaule TaxID=74823 RepID=A0AA41VCU4_PAPNU|nr:hypothetical protein [Papaver nudicaule]
MGIRLRSMVSHSKQILRLTRTASGSIADVPKGHCAVYVGDVEKKRFVVPVSYLNHPIFQDLLSRAEEEFGFDHPMGGLSIPCKEAAFIELTSQMNLYPVTLGACNFQNVFACQIKLSYSQEFLTKFGSQIYPIFYVVRCSKRALCCLCGDTEKKRFVVPVSYLNHPLFQDLLSRAEEEFGFHHPMGGLTIPCKVSVFVDLTSQLNAS